MSSRTILIDEISIILRKSKKAKNIIISIKPFEGAVVSIPERLSYNDGERVAKEKIEWIRTHIFKIKKHEEDYHQKQNENEFITRNHKLSLVQADIEKIMIKVSGGTIQIKYPLSYSEYSSLVQKAIRKGIAKAYREEAKEFLPKRINDLSDKYNLPFNEVYIKDIKSRWGSCSGKNNINLSIHLMRLPDILIDYVLLHELAHTKIRNHSREFWRFLDVLTGNSKKLDRELKKHRIL